MGEWGSRRRRWEAGGGGGLRGAGGCERALRWPAGAHLERLVHAVGGQGLVGLGVDAHHHILAVGGGGADVDPQLQANEGVAWRVGAGTTTQRLPAGHRRLALPRRGCVPTPSPQAPARRLAL